MARSKETYGKKEIRNKKAKKRKAKESRRLEKKEQGKSGMDDMIAYVDEHGNISDTPPDLENKEEINIEDIEIGVPKKEFREEDPKKVGTITSYDSLKGYGFIIDDNTRESIFIHRNDCDIEISNGLKVEFLTEKGVKGLKAINVKLPEK
ncbi:MAG: DNA-binding protein [Marinilabiliales bacterium]|nr:MAG: DNA-binding protein [Marinilabiliales bacterium]